LLAAVGAGAVIVVTGVLCHSYGGCHLLLVVVQDAEVVAAVAHAGEDKW